MATSKTPARHGYGWIPQRPDVRDRLWTPADRTVQETPAIWLLDFTKIPVLDQGQQGSCTGHGPLHLVMFDQLKQGATEPTEPSPAMCYYDARVPEGTTGQDSGAQVRDSLKGIVQWGLCTNQQMPYDQNVFNVAPTAAQYKQATQTGDTAIEYMAVQYPHINAAIALGYPVVFGFTVYESFETQAVADTGIVPVPEAGEKVLGGHCVCTFGYNASEETAQGIPARTKVCRNQWGEDWGAKVAGVPGNFFLPQWYWDNGQCTDHWVIHTIGKPAA